MLVQGKAVAMQPDDQTQYVDTNGADTKRRQRHTQKRQTGQYLITAETAPLPLLLLRLLGNEGGGDDSFIGGGREMCLRRGSGLPRVVEDHLCGHSLRRVLVEHALD